MYILIYLIERHNKIRSPDSGESMCHNNSSSACPSPVQCCLHNTLTLIVQGGCRFVQQKNWRVFHEGTRNGNTLLLTARQLGTTLTNLYKLNILTEFNALIVQLYPEIKLSKEKKSKNKDRPPPLLSLNHDF